VIETIEPGDGGSDVIDTGSGEDIALGGAAGDTLTLGAGDDVALGDNGALIYDEEVGIVFDGVADALTITPEGGADPSTLDRIRATAPTDGGNDIICGKEGKDILVGGTGVDWVMGDDGTGSSGTADLADIVIGDQVDIALLDNTVTGIVATERENAAAGDGDVLIGNHDEDILIGAHGDDFIDGDIVLGDADLSDDLIFGDQVTTSFTAWSARTICSATVRMTT
jgi:Ca2+-binding RTX toxin-like protein